MAIRVLGGKGTDRLEAISDGVFAIVLTILVLQFQVPTVPDAQAETQLLPHLITYLPLLTSYIISFSTVGLYWVVHQNLFQNIERHDRILLYLNLLFLFTVSFLPFPTQLVGTYSTHLTWIIYATNFTLVGLTLTVTWWYAARYGLTTDTIDNQRALLISVRGLTIPIVFLLSIVVSVINLGLAYWTLLLIVPLQLLYVRVYRSYQEDR